MAGRDRPRVQLRRDPGGEAGGRSPILSIDRSGAEARRTIDWHAHDEAMLLWSATATVAMSTPARDWLVPPGYGLWVPPRIVHSEKALRPGELCVVRFAPDLCPVSWPEPVGISVGSLLRELVSHLHDAEPDDPSRAHAELLVFDLLAPLPVNAIDVSMPADPRVRAIAEQIIADPGDTRDLAFWAHRTHTGVRTLSRLFARETGLSFGQWRTHVRMRAAAQHLADGRSVNATARAVGYRKPSAFIAAFRRSTGRTPGACLRVEPTTEVGR
ncbi:putative transcriptional regulator, AraC family [Nocardia nova SH22a]|uniref:HTH-type transcriptional regulator RipA n=1 Tax=Nocardia nova SH22a TaxID=1415166 RepID=W5THB4_9NOCA|nr:AraC family transcriptional regulator [Nocardia nova]AHH18755.1 putative transcriptional regulator, AraC family [Nocardia nova SH22a]